MKNIIVSILCALIPISKYRKRSRNFLKGMSFYKIIYLIKLYFFSYYEKKYGKKYFLNLKPRKEKIIVSLTTYGTRAFKINYTIRSLLFQKTKPDKIILWLDEKEFNKNNLPENIKYFNNLIDIRFCPNYRSYKKIIPTLKEHPNDLIITADDDIIYPDYWIGGLYNAYKTNKTKVYCYEIWKNGFETFNFPIIGTGCGILLKKEFLTKDILDWKLISKLCPTDDDLFISYLLHKNNKKLVQLKKGKRRFFFYRNWLLSYFRQSSLGEINLAKETREKRFTKFKNFIKKDLQNLKTL
ncbi:MAG: hypothetical protein ACTSXL_03125 [Alphaproteobacteria bacterium]